MHAGCVRRRPVSARPRTRRRTSWIRGARPRGGPVERPVVRRAAGPAAAPARGRPAVVVPPRADGPADAASPAESRVVAESRAVRAAGPPSRASRAAGAESRAGGKRAPRSGFSAWRRSVHTGGPRARRLKSRLRQRDAGLRRPVGAGRGPWGARGPSRFPAPAPGRGVPRGPAVRNARSSSQDIAGPNARFAVRSRGHETSQRALHPR